MERARNQVPRLAGHVLSGMSDHEDAALLKLEIGVDGALDDTTWRCLVSLRRRLRERPPELCALPLRLEWPTRQRPSAVLCLEVRAGQRAAVEATIQEEARAAGRDVRLRAEPGARPADVGLPQIEHRAELRARFGECLACATDLHLEAGRSGRGCAFGYRERQNLALGLLALGLSTLAEGHGDWTAYPAYHRDWLIRGPILQTGNGFGSASMIRRLLDQQLALLGRVDCASLCRLPAAMMGSASANSWVGRVRSFGSRLAELAGDARFRVDAFASDGVYPVAFRLFHTLARQFGIALLDEALLHHILATASGVPDAPAGFCLTPQLDELRSAKPGRVTHSTGAAGEGLPWKEVIASSGVDGRQWTATYLRSEAVVGDHLAEALRLLRTGELQEGYARLEQVRTYRGTLREEYPAFTTCWAASSTAR